MIRKRRLLSGLAAGAAALLFSFVARIFLDGVFVPELAALTVFSSASGELQSVGVETLGFYAKYLVVVMATLVNLVVYSGLAGWLLKRESTSNLRGALLDIGKLLPAAYVVILAISVVLTQFTEISTHSVSLMMLAMGLIWPSVVFGLIGAAMNFSPADRARLLCEPKEKHVFVPSRRVFIRDGAVASVALGFLVYGLGDLLLPKVPPAAAPQEVLPAGVERPQRTGDIFDNVSVRPLVASEVTPNDQFYKVQINVFDPSVPVQDWRLKVKGLVNTELTFTYDDLRTMPSVEQHTTLECVSNEIGGDLIGNALWSGVPLRELLNTAGMKPEAEYVVFRCFDGYSVGIPLDRALLDSSVLAIDMNGEPLSAGHGFPLRAIVPGIYGMMNAKWITEIELVGNVYEGYWQTRGWTNDARIHTNTIIRTPPQMMDLKGATPIAGIAFSGDRGISKVEVSTDEGQTWTDAMLRDPLSNYSWVVWALEWIPPKAGRFKVMVRATDKQGQTQTAQITAPFPNGATGYHVINVKVI